MDSDSGSICEVNENGLPPFNRPDLDALMADCRRHFSASIDDFIVPLKCFSIAEKLGEGTYGVVYKGRCRRTGTIVALKRVKLVYGDEGIPATALREMDVLRRLQHPNIVHMLNVVYEENKLYLVFEFVNEDLKQFMKRSRANGGVLENITILNLFYQITQGVLYCHLRAIVHRDLKPQNILVSSTGEAKIADFGLARTFSLPFGVYTREIVTLWYRAPEVLLGTERYSCAVDMWSLGCIFAELFTGKPILRGDCDIDQLLRTFQLLGTPCEADSPGITSLPHFSFRFPRWTSTFDELMQATTIDESSLDCLKGMLSYNTATRLGAKHVLEHICFNGIDKGKLPCTYP